MLSVIDDALRHISYTIPREVLEIFFTDTSPFSRYRPAQVSDRIRMTVIEPRVKVDCDLIGGTQDTIPLDGVPSELLEDSQRVYRIPKRLTNGRSISSVLSVTYGTNSYTLGGGNAGYAYGGQGFNSFGSSGITNLVQGAVAAAGNIPIVGNARVFLIGDNTIMIKNEMLLPPGSWLRCILQNDEEMNNIPPRAQVYFNRLCSLAVKSYIYTNRIQLGTGQIYSGASLDIIRDIVEGFADAEDMYQEMLTTTWSKVAKLSDPLTKRRHIDSLVGSWR